MNTIKTLTRYALYTLLCLVILSSCEEEKTRNLTHDDIMVIWENGYRQGYLNSLTKSKDEREIDFKKDSTKMRNLWE